MHTVEYQVLENGWTEFTLSTNDISIRFLNYGGIITEINMPDRNGNVENIVLAYDDMKEYERNPFYLGAIIGRVAGRIKEGRFKLNGEVHTLEQNEFPHHLHGGREGFHQVLWDYTIIEDEDVVGVQLSHNCRSEQSGYPGNIKVYVNYQILKNGDFKITYHASSDEDTIFTMTNHSYFNLSGNAKDTVDTHKITMDTDRMVLLNEQLIPYETREIEKGSTFDFSNGRLLTDGFASHHPQNTIVDNGYDHYFMFKENGERKIFLEHENSGRKLQVITNQPGLVLYTSNGMDEEEMLRFGKSKKHLGVCLETQTYPAALWLADLPSIYLKKNQSYLQETTYRFTHKD